MSELKTDRARYASVSSSYYRPCGFLATLGVIGLVGVLAAPTGAAAALFTMKEDYGYGAMTGGYREKHVRKSRGEERSNASPRSLRLFQNLRHETCGVRSQAFTFLLGPRTSI